MLLTRLTSAEACHKLYLAHLKRAPLEYLWDFFFTHYGLARILKSSDAACKRARNITRQRIDQFQLCELATANSPRLLL